MAILSRMQANLCEIEKQFFTIASSILQNESGSITKRNDSDSRYNLIQAPNEGRRGQNDILSWRIQLFIALAVKTQG